MKPADDLKVVVFDQHRQKLPLSLSLKEALSPTGDFVQYRGQNIHVNGWAQRFLFDPDRLALPLSALSGGERARILIARLMQEPADVLLLDEPTNDLDIPTLETLEQALREFPGGLVLISHDRSLIDQVATQVLAMDGHGHHGFFADRLQAQEFLKSSEKQHTASKRALSTPAPAMPTPSQTAGFPSPKKLSFQQQRLLEETRTKIDQCEQALQACYKNLESAEGPRLTELCARAAELERQRDLLYERWLALES
jgi:ATP-binding cassette subfamily F protein uup